RLFKPNLQKASVLVNGKRVQMHICAKCLKKFKKERKIPSYSSLALG
ncbi:hypothetical protein HY008_03150, partial [Candidatus Woesebacteria bacterium]|nr:hypothetical protein [Candidatus Woesebacteria bacterium]